ncbi:hypothetical protein BH23VER1_BH23VER1_22530 [soil metagenome]
MDDPDPTTFKAVRDPFVSYAVAATPAAIGFAMGILAGGKLREKHRPTAALVVLSAGILAAAPLAIHYVKRRLNDPESKRGSVRRLRSIRDAGVPTSFAS